METRSKPVSVFYCYDEHDEDLRKQLQTHLANLEQQNLMKGWHKGEISAGAERESSIREHLEAAQIILLLISSHFFSCEHCLKVEMMRALARYDLGEAYVIPILLRACEYEGAPFSQLEFLPNDRKAITTRSNADEAFEEVAKGLRKVIEEIRSKTGEQWIDEGKRYHEKKQYTKALVTYERALRLNENDARAQRYKGDALYDLGRYIEALKAYDLALHLDPGSLRIKRNRADTYRQLRHYNKALEAYEEVLQVTPTAGLYNEKGDTLFRLKRYEEALLAYEQAIRIDPQFTYGHNNKGNALLRLKRYREATVAYEVAIGFDESFALAHNNRGRALFYLGKYQDSLQAYQRALQLNPNFAQAYENCAETLEKLGRIQEASLNRAKASELRRAR